MKTYNKVEMEEVTANAWLERTLMKFAEIGVVRLRKRLCRDDKYTCFTVHMFKQIKMEGIPKHIMRLVNTVIQLLAPIALLYVLYVFYKYGIGMSTFGEALTLPAFLVATAIGVVLHEFGHAAASWACGARVFEWGVMFSRFGLFRGAYVLSDSDYVCGVTDRVKVSMAGVQMNLLLAAAFMLTAEIHPSMNMFMFCLCGAYTNLFLACLNTFMPDTDGMSALKDILRDKHVNKSIKRAMFFFLSRKKGAIRKRKASIIHFIVCFSVGFIRLIPVFYLLEVASCILHVRLHLGRMIVFSVRFALLFLFGILVWLFINSLAWLPCRAFARSG